MGCTQSKIENEEAVTRCKERKFFMKEAVSSRNAFAAAHSLYAMSLKNTGAALSDYAHGEVQNPNQSVPVIPSSSSSSVSSTSAISQSSAAIQQPSFVETLPPPPPPPSLNTAFEPPAPLQRAFSMPDIKIPPKPIETPAAATIMEEEDGHIEEDDEMELENRDKLTRKSRSHKSSVSASAATTVGSSKGRKEDEGHLNPPMAVEQSHQGIYDFIFSPVENMPGTSLEVKPEKPPPQPQQVEPVVERKSVEEKPRKSEDNGGSSGKAEVIEKAVEAEKVAIATVGRGSKKVKGGGLPEKRGMKVGVNLLQIFAELDDHFLKASEGAHGVSKMLEATRLHYHSNFADNRGHIDHSARVMRVITWNRSFKGLNTGDDGGKDDFDSEENETHATVLDKLLAWEKKLYDEVKAGEVMKFEYQRKVASLNRLKKRNSNSDALERAKATVSHLHTRYIVDMQSMDSTVSEINRLRDQQLYPKLVHLVHGMGKMWETMRVHHEQQSKIVTSLRSLDISQSPKETTLHHHERTIQLLAVVQEWHTQFCRLIDYQKEYIKFLTNWLKLNLIPIESSVKEKVSSPPRIQNPPIQTLLIAWHDNLDKLPDEIGRTAIYNFAAVISTIMQQQEEEMKLKDKCDETRKEVGRKTRQFEDWYSKYVQQRTSIDEMETDRHNDGDDGDNNNHPHRDAVIDKQIQLDAVKKRLEEEEEVYRRQCLHVREKSLASLKTRLPELFRAMSDVAYSCSGMYANLSSISTQKHSVDEEENVI